MSTTVSIPFIDLQAQYQLYKEELDAAIQSVLDSSAYIMGPEVQALNDELKSFTGAHALGCSSGTDALLLAMMAIGVGPGDEIITTPFTFIATVEMIVLLGATPVFVDVSEDDFNLDVTQIEAKITDKTKAIVPVSLYGQTPDMDTLNALATQHNLMLIEDGAQSFGATYKGNRSCNLSPLAATSFFPAKPLGCYGDGGAVFTQNIDLYDQLKSRLAHGQTERYRHPHIGINGRLDAIQAAVLRVKLKHYNTEIQKRHAIAEAYTQGLQGLKGLVTPKLSPECTSVFAQYTLRVQNREAFRAHLSDHGVPTAVHYPIPVHLQEAYAHLGFEKGSLPVAERMAEEVVSLPMSAFLKPDDQAHILKTIQQFFK